MKKYSATVPQTDLVVAIVVFDSCSLNLLQSYKEPTMAERPVVFYNSYDPDDEVWDDSLLIKEYEAAQKKVAAAIKNNGAIPKKTAVAEPAQVAVGQWCRCVYSQDGQEYEAQVISIENDKFRIRFVGYNNEEDHELSHLLPSKGKAARTKQEKESERLIVSESEVTKEIHFTEPSIGTQPNGTLPQHFKSESFVPPPIPPTLLSSTGADKVENEALASMLMSWYMSGYHTGYYNAMQKFRAAGREK